MADLKSFLEELGFGKNEIEVYQYLISVKDATVLQISKKTMLHRSNIYGALNTLMNKGVVFSYEDPVKKYYSKNPRTLLYFIKNKEVEFEDILKELKNKVSVATENRIGTSKGKTVLVELISDLLKLNKPIYIYGLKKDTYDILGPSMKLFEKERIKRHIYQKIIYDSGSESAMSKMARRKFTLIRSLPSSYNSDITTWICKDKVIIVKWEKDITVTEIEDEEIARSYAQNFNLLWRGARCRVCR